MDRPGPLVRSIVDTARWAAVYRADENERECALFRDPFVRRLAGVNGAQIASELSGKKRVEWAWVTRTYLFDQFIAEEVAHGVDMVVNLAAGLDARPYRMALPRSLRWVEVDLPELLDYKESILRGEKPACTLETIPLDLSDRAARIELFKRLGRESRSALVITEGLLIYLTSDEVGQLAADLTLPRSFRRWTLDLANAILLRKLRKHMNAQLSQASAELRFGPEEGPAFFTRFGWRPVEARSLLNSAARAKRVSLLMRMLARLSESGAVSRSMPWGGVCLLEAVSEHGR